MSVHPKADWLAPQTGCIMLHNAALYFRAVGKGQPTIVLHGGPDFDHNYLLPELDCLSDGYRLIYYDQRGRGCSAGNVQPEDVTIESEIEDIERVRQHFGLEAAAILGHSWGGLLAMEYAIRHPRHISHLILMNTAPASHEDFLLLRQERRQKSADDLEKMKAISSTAAYVAGEHEADADYYRLHFKTTLRQPDQLESIVQRLRANVTPEGIQKARAIEQRLYEETWLASEYDLLPKLKRLSIPALVLHGDHDLIPAACAVHAANAIPGARFVLLNDCGHFSFLECPAQVRKALDILFQTTKGT